MAGQSPHLTLPHRALALGIYAALIYAAYIAVTGKYLPTGGGECGWLYAGIAIPVLALLDAPWFRPPRVALAQAIGASANLVQFDLSTLSQFRPELDAFRWASVGLAAIVGACAVAAMYLNEKNPDNRLGRICYRVADGFGHGAILFTPAALISILGFYQSLPLDQLLLLAGWVFFVVVRPVELGMSVWQQIRALKTSRLGSPQIGTVERVDHPNIVRVALRGALDWRKDQVYAACMADGQQVYVLPLFIQTHEEKLIGTGLCSRGVATPIPQAVTGHVYHVTGDDLRKSLEKELSGVDAAVELVGFVVEGSSIAEILFEVAMTANLQEGTVVFVNFGGVPVYYQIFDAKTAEESFEKNPRGKHVVSALQLGQYDPAKGFLKYAWLPAMNQPVFKLNAELAAPKDMAPAEFVVGEVPSTGIGLRVNLESLVEYHCAILGITGTGKTELALDVIREALKRDTKVFCVDFTGEYRARLADAKPQSIGFTAEQGSKLEELLFAIETGKFGAPDEKKALKAFLKEIGPVVEKQVKEFLSPAGSALGIFDLAEVTNTRATLRTTELYLSTIMQWARQNRKTRRILIVLEEAHTVIPESSWAGFDADTQLVVSRIGQIALQGRKYGVGLLIVSQRTALVSKTILSQCNTFFTHSLIDQTSLGFLESVYSAQHIRAIPNLRFLEFLAFGRAIKSERPMLVRRAWDDKKLEASRALDAKAPAGLVAPESQPAQPPEAPTQAAQ